MRSAEKRGGVSLFYGTNWQAIYLLTVSYASKKKEDTEILYLVVSLFQWGKVITIWWRGGHEIVRELLQVKTNTGHM